MTKQINGKQVGPFGDIEINCEDLKKDKYKKEANKHENESKNSSKFRKDKLKDVSKKDGQNQKSHVLERRERERRERYEREVAEAERNEREMEFERWEKERLKKSKNNGSVFRYKPRRPPAGYKDPHEVCKQVIPKKLKEEKRQEIKALMNCIAFTPSQADLTVVSEEERTLGKERKVTNEEMDNSVSSDTTSDITDVTPRSSSSGCSSMSKHSVCAEKLEKLKIKPESAKNKMVEHKLSRENENNLKKNNIKNTEEEKKEMQPLEQEIKNLTEVELEEMKYLQDAFEDLDLDEETSEFASSIISGLSEERRAKCNRKNMTFTNEQLREIERVNLILLKKIMNHKKPRVKPMLQPTANRKTSAAINRSKMEEKIERENKILLKKLQSAKGTTGTLSKKPSQSTCC